jgi:hypothetical protein
MKIFLCKIFQKMGFEQFLKFLKSLNSKNKIFDL